MEQLNKSQRMKAMTKVLFVCVLLTLVHQLLQASPIPGYVIEWGWNTAAGTAAPVRQVASNVVAISVGPFHSLALRADGTVLGWGDNFFGETLGGKTSEQAVTNGTVRINGKILSNVVSIAAGRGFSLALNKNGAIIAWGDNYVPAGLTNIVAIAAAGFTTLVQNDAGTVVAWESEKSLPQYGQSRAVAGLSNVTSVAVGESYQGVRTLALKRDGTVMNWGGESIYKDATPPAGLSNVIAIAAGASHSLALKSDGTVVGWGWNKVGEATGTATIQSPEISSGQVIIGGQILSNIVSIAAGRGYSMALKRDGAVATWGRMVNDLYPATVPAGLSNVVAIAAGETYCLAITTNTAVAERFRR